MLLAHMIVFLGTLLLSLVLTWLVRKAAVRWGWVKAPASKRHVHTLPIPRLGGVAIFISFIAMIGLALVAAGLSGMDREPLLRLLLSIVVPGTLVFLVGLYDDLWSASPSAKFAIQCVAALLLFAGGLGVAGFPVLFGAHEFGWLATLMVTILWVVGITNAFNLIDGIDGLAAGSALFSTLTVLIVSLVGRNHLVSLLATGLAGALLGFIRFNLSPATIFLGDCGSLFIGFMLSALSLAGTQTQKSSTLISVTIPLVCFGLPVLDTALAVLRRWLSGSPLFAADREHIHHKLLQQGFSQPQVAIILYSVSALFGMLSLLLLSPGGGAIGVVLFVVGVGTYWGVRRLNYFELFELRRAAERTMGEKEIIVNDIAIRRAMERMSQVCEVAQLIRALEEGFRTTDFDAFELILGPFSGQEKTARGQSFTLGESPGATRFAWDKRRLSDNGAEPAVSGWKLTLELIATDGKRRGSFSLYRNYNKRPLLVDISLLTSEFQSVLADAVNRSVSGAWYGKDGETALLGQRRAVAV